MHYEEILKWREDVYNATVVAPLQMAMNNNSASTPRTARHQMTWSTATASTLNAPTVTPLNHQDAVDDDAVSDPWKQSDILANDANMPLPGDIKVNVDVEENASMRPFDSDTIPPASTATLVDMMSNIPVPASLAPASGQAPTILKRPVSASFSSVDVPASALRLSGSGTPLTSSSTAPSLSNGISARDSPPGYALGLAAHEPYYTPVINLGLPNTRSDFFVSAAPFNRQKVSRIA